jgi:hypothetical protein
VNPSPPKARPTWFETVWDGMAESRVNALSFDPLDGWCDHCGVNPVYGPGLCSMCQADEDFLTCEFCQGVSCTGTCEDEEDLT